MVLGISDIEADLAAAPATPLVLTVLSEGERDGYAVIKRLREGAGSDRQWSDAMFYPLFRRLARLGYLSAEWRISPDGRRRNYYAITDDGRAVLRRRHRSALRPPARGRGWGWLLATVGEGWRLSVMPLTGAIPCDVT